jgi:hypothetical protein
MYCTSNDQQYINVCQSVSDNALMLIKKIFDEVVQRYLYGTESPIRLEFDLNKQQLSALIFLLTKARMILQKERCVIRKYDFFEFFFGLTLLTICNTN